MGVVIRNDMGQVMVSLLQKTMLPFIAIEVEAMATRRALETGFDQVILEGDSHILITALRNSSHSLSHFGHIVKDIQYLASCFSEIHYSHARRHYNTVVHSLVRRAIPISQMQV